jgi:hypothetical protein
MTSASDVTACTDERPGEPMISSPALTSFSPTRYAVLFSAFCRSRDTVCEAATVRRYGGRKLQYSRLVDYERRRTNANNNNIDELESVDEEDDDTEQRRNCDKPIPVDFPSSSSSATSR